MDAAAVLAAYTAQVRRSTAPDGTGARLEADDAVIRRIAPPGRGGSMILWSDLDERTADAVIAAQVRMFAPMGGEFEWKLYSHDRPGDLASRLLAAGFVPEEPESLMVAEVAEVARRLSSARPPDGVTLHRVTDAAGIDRLARVHELVFGRDDSELRESLRAQLADFPMTELVVAVAGDQDVSAGRIEFPPGADFAGLWGGGTLPGWRGRGIYRALVRYRAEFAAARGYAYLTVDASDQSRPILERAGFTCLATTTPYIWSPPAGGS